MADLPEHIHAFPLYTSNTVFKNGVGVWDSSNKKFIIGDGSTNGGIAVAMEKDIYSKEQIDEKISNSSLVKQKEINNLTSNIISLEDGDYPVLIKWISTNKKGVHYISNNEFYDNKIDLTKLLAINNIGSYSNILHIEILYLNYSETSTVVGKKVLNGLSSNEIQFEEGEMPFLMEWTAGSKRGNHYITEDDFQNNKIDLENFFAINNISNYSEITSISVLFFDKSDK
jgi:hypothetical protein